MDNEGLPLCNKIKLIMQGSKPLFYFVCHSAPEHDRDFPFGLEDPNTKRQAAEQAEAARLHKGQS